MENEKFIVSNTEKFDDSALAAFVTDLEQYDRDHGQATWLGRGMAALILGNVDLDPGDDEKEGKESIKHIRKDIEANLKIQDIIEKHSETLKKLGLELTSPNKKGDVDEAEMYAVGEIEVDLKDNNKYIAFLESIKEGTITPAQNKILEIVGKKIANQFRTKYDFGDTDNQLLEILFGAKDIIAQYKRLGVDSGMRDLSDYMENASTGYLREYVLAKNHHLFEPIGEGYNLSTYQRDASYEVYTRKWDENVFQVLNEIKKNPDAQPLREKILSYAREAVEFGEADIERLKAKNYSAQYMDGITRGVAEVKEKLSKEV